MTQTDPYAKYVWRQTEPGVWKRSLDEVEGFYAGAHLVYAATGRKYRFVTGHFSLDFHPPSGSSAKDIEAQADDALKKSWTALRYEHPTLACITERDPVTGDFIKVYRNNDPATFDATFVTLPAKLSAEEHANADPPHPDYSTLCVIPTPGSSEPGRPLRREIFFQIAHDNIDGMGGWLLLGDYVRLVGRAFAEGANFHVPVCDGSEAERLSPPLRVAAAIPPTPSESLQKRLANLGEELAASNPPEGTRTLSIPYKKGVTKAGKQKVVHLTIGEEENDAIVKACKAAGISVTHAFHTAIPFVLLNMHASERGAEPIPMRQSSLLLRNERPNCVPPYDTKHPATVYHSISVQAIPVDLTLPPLGEKGQLEDEGERKTRFLEAARTVKQWYQKFSADPEYAALGIAVYGNVWPLPPVGAEPGPPPPHEGDAGALLSSLGRIDGVIPPRPSDSLEVSDTWMVAHILGPEIAVYLTGYRGRSDFRIAYNDAWHEREEMGDFLAKVYSEVLWQFGIQK
ncbi:hypothetical protein ACRALDRAFT_1079512 [Sodiomyces alcalophilus JCM 7366]|uniref:uncharacterized protein n=1 Tax=Sodiomyces alcalophilus JCM 7366 TaxID=591952 RepID=UPI0039B3CE91